LNITGPHLVKSDVLLSFGLFSQRVVTLREEPIGTYRWPAMVIEIVVVVVVEVDEVARAETLNTPHDNKQNFY
jgi:hypothetical protein